MTEQEWLSSADTSELVTRLREKVSERKLRLFAVACCRRVERFVLPNRSDDARKALVVAEKFADGRGTRDDLLHAQGEAEYCTGSDSCPFLYVLDVPNGSSLEGVPDMCSGLFFMDELERLQDPKQPGSFRNKKIEAEFKRNIATEKASQFAMLSDITGDLSRPAMVARDWRTSTVRALANSIYAERAFDRMPILADALEEAGCDNIDILTHCRGDGPHVRGCWVIDKILGKE